MPIPGGRDFHPPVSSGIGGCIARGRTSAEPRKIRPLNISLDFSLPWVVYNPASNEFVPSRADTFSGRRPNFMPFFFSGPQREEQIVFGEQLVERYGKSFLEFSRSRKSGGREIEGKTSWAPLFLSMRSQGHSLAASPGGPIPKSRGESRRVWAMVNSGFSG